MKETIYFVCLQKQIKDNDKTERWVSHSKLRSLDKDEFFKITQIFNENQSSVTGSIEKEENVSENTTDDVD